MPILIAGISSTVRLSPATFTPPLLTLVRSKVVGALHVYGFDSVYTSSHLALSILA